MLVQSKQTMHQKQLENTLKSCSYMVSHLVHGGRIQDVWGNLHAFIVFATALHAHSGMPNPMRMPLANAMFSGCLTKHGHLCVRCGAMVALEQTDLGVAEHVASSLFLSLSAHEMSAATQAPPLPPPTLEVTRPLLIHKCAQQCVRGHERHTRRVLILCSKCTRSFSNRAHHDKMT